MRFNRRRSRHPPLGLSCAFTFILGELESRRLPGRCIGFETTETAAIANAANALRLINEVQGAGCRFSLSDSGSGLSAFA
jgi:EAL domain-containing protein (putative c-di-GMP-specific phosphodiesterase class I)